MVEQLSGRRPLFDVHFETRIEKRLEFGREAFAVLNFGRSVGGDEEERPQWPFVEVGRLPVKHLDRHYSKRPNVHFRTVGLARYHFKFVLLVRYKEIVKLKEFFSGNLKGKLLYHYCTFGCHPIGSADHRLALVLLLRDLSTKAKVGYFHRSVHAQQNVVRLYIAMDHVPLMQKLENT